jgi:hypothetical protein
MAKVWRQSQNFLERLQDADKNSIPILIIYGKDTLLPDERGKLQKLNNLKVRFCRNLHSKCYVNENSLVLTSMNMHEFSEQSNREMGVLYDKSMEADKEIYIAALGEINSIIRASYEEKETKAANETKKAKSSTSHRPESSWNMDISDALKVWFPTFSRIIGADTRGYCIRCGKRTPYNLDAPYCSSCFSEWVGYGGNTSYIEKHGHCHTCGRHSQPSRYKPECHSCFWK